MKHLVRLLFLFLFSVMPFCESFAQKTKDKIVMAEFPGGQSALHEYLLTELMNFCEELDVKETGEVLVTFSVGMDGSISGVRVVRSASEELDAAAVRVISKMPRWIPAKKNGRVVRADLTIPINFKVIYENRHLIDVSQLNNCRF